MRVIISMTTTHARRDSLRETLDSIAAQTRKPDHVCIFSNVQPGVGYAPNVILFPRVDVGPVSKLYAIEERWITDDDLIVTIDDDIIYEPRWLETLVDAAEKHPDAAVGMAGWNVAGFVTAHRRGEQGWYEWAQAPGICDVLEGFAGVAYRRRFFDFDLDGTAPVLRPPEMFKYVDDVWIASCLRRRGVPRALVHTKMCHERANPLPGLHNRPDFVELNRQAAIAAFGDR